MNWKVFYNDGKPLRKCQGFAAAAPIIGDAIGALVSLRNTDQVNATNFQIQKSAEEWQAAENEKQRSWEENQKLIERQYNTPSAQLQRYKEAGINPFLMDKSGQVGSGQTQAPSAPPLSGAPATIPAIAPNMPNFGQTILQSLGVEAQIGNQQSQMLKNVMEAVSTALKDGNEPLAYQILNYGMPMVKGVNFDSSQIIREMKLRNDILEYNKQVAAVESSIQQKYGEDKAKQVLSNMQAEYDFMQSQYHVNEELAKLHRFEQDYTQARTDSERKEIEVKQAKIKDLLASAADHYASAVAHNAAARLSVSEAVIKEDAKNYLVGKLKADFAQSAFSASESAADYESNEYVRSWKKSKTAKEWNEFRWMMDKNPASGATQSVLGTIGNIFKINVVK